MLVGSRFRATVLFFLVLWSVEVYADAERFHLPYAGSWNTHEYEGGFSPEIQFELIDKGHYLLPWFFLPPPGKSLDLDLYEFGIKEAAKRKLPISFISTQWERVLSEDKRFVDLPYRANPNVVDEEGRKYVSPFAPSETWFEAGRMWSDRSFMRILQEWYPDPPFVLFISNNEHTKLTPKNIFLDQRAKSQASGLSYAEQRESIGDKWIERYRKLQQGFSDGLDSWRKRAKYIGYNAFTPSTLGRWAKWIDYSLYVSGEGEPWLQAWDGASVPYYLHDWDRTTDYHVWSPQVGAMNWQVTLEGLRAEERSFWFELSIWDGHQPGRASDKRKFFDRLGNSYTPERYLGLAQYGLWLTRPRTIREFRNHTQKYLDNSVYFEKILEAVKFVHENDVAREFWMHGRLVKNTSRTHPYHHNLPEDLQKKQRWYLLDTSLDARRPWTYDTEILAFAVALELGTKPNRRWLLYAFSPLGDRDNVSVTIPGYKGISVDFAQRGSFYVVHESPERPGVFRL